MVRLALVAVLFIGAVASSAVERPVDVNKALHRRQIGFGGGIAGGQFTQSTFQSSMTTISNSWGQFLGGVGGFGGPGVAFQSFGGLLQQSLSIFQLFQQSAAFSFLQAQAIQQQFIQVTQIIFQTITQLSSQFGGAFQSWWGQSQIASSFLQSFQSVLVQSSQIINFGFLNNIIGGQGGLFRGLGFNSLFGLNGFQSVSQSTTSVQSSSSSVTAGGGFGGVGGGIGGVGGGLGGIGGGIGGIGGLGLKSADGKKNKENKSA